MTSAVTPTDSHGHLSEQLAAVTIADGDNQPSIASGEPNAGATNPEQHVLFHHMFTTGNIVLVSSDDVHFRCNLPLLQQHSAFFRDLPDIPPPQKPGDTVPFLNANALTLEIMLCALDSEKDFRSAPSVAVLD